MFVFFSYSFLICSLVSLWTCFIDSYVPVPMFVHMYVLHVYMYVCTTDVIVICTIHTYEHTYELSLLRENTSTWSASSYTTYTPIPTRCTSRCLVSRRLFAKRLSIAAEVRTVWRPFSVSRKLDCCYSCTSTRFVNFDFVSDTNTYVRTYVLYRYVFAIRPIPDVYIFVDLSIDCDDHAISSFLGPSLLTFRCFCGIVVVKYMYVHTCVTVFSEIP